MQQNQQRIIRPDEVRTLDTHSERKPDRYFYIIYGEHVWECDGYLAPGEPGSEPQWMIILTCPVCRQNLTINSQKKKLMIDEKGLHVAESIACSHPGEFGAPCKFKVAIEPPSKREDQHAMVTCVDGISRQVKVDAVAKRV